MATPAPTLSLRYLGGCPGLQRRELVEITVYPAYFELHAKRWGWRIGISSIVDVGEPESAGEDGPVLPVVWRAPAGAATLLLAGADVRRLRFLLAQAVAVDRVRAEQASLREEPEERRRIPPGPSAWQRELRRMRRITFIALAAALGSLVIVTAVALATVARSAKSGHWGHDRVTVEQDAGDVQRAQDSGDDAGLSAALQTLVDECQRLASYDGDAANTGDDFAAVQQTCATAGVTLF